MTFKIGPHDFRSPPFNKTEYNWFRSVTRYFVGLLPIASLEPTVLSSFTFAPVAQANAPAQTGSYVQADVQAIADLANANKAALNAVIAQLQTQNAQLVAQNQTLSSLIAAVGATPV